MKKLLGLFLLLSATLLAQSKTINLGAHGKLTLYLLGDWTVDDSDLGERTITFSPKKDDVNADMKITITHPEQDRFSRKDKLKMQTEIAGTPYAEQSVEGKAIAREFNVQSGFGYHCDFTDPNLVGKPPKKGDFKTMTIGLIRLAPDVVLEVVIEADGFSSEPYQQLLGAIEGMEYTPGKQ